MPRMVSPIAPPEHPRVYVSVESRVGQLIIDGPLSLLRDLMTVMQPPAQKGADADAVTNAG